MTLPPPPSHPNGLALWRILHDHCIPDQTSRQNPSPCAIVSISGGEAHGFVVLKDRVGATQYLLMPTARITGIEDSALLQPQSVNYFARAWDERGLVEERLGHPLARTRVSIAINSAYGRSQDQLHLHIDCIDGSVAAALNGLDSKGVERWPGRAVKFRGHTYRVRWLDDAKLTSADPFKLLADSMPGARRQMGAWTIALVGAKRADGSEGFYLLADRANPATGDHGSSEELQDHSCHP